MVATLAVIDLQEIFADPDGGWFVPSMGQIIEPIERLVGAYQPAVVFTRFIAGEHPSGSWAAYYDRWSFAKVPPDHPRYRLVAPFAGAAPVISCETFSKWGPELASIVGPGGTLVLCGVSTDCCVLATALAAADAGVFVRVVADACAGADEATHAAALALLELQSPLVEVISAAEAVAALG